MLKMCSLLPIACLFAASLHAQEDSAEDTWLPGYYMQQATDNVLEKASLMTAFNGYTWNTELTMAASLLEVGNTLALDLVLEPGVAYSILGGGDEDVVDIDLYIIDEQGKVISADVEDDDTPILEFDVSKKGNYSLRAQLVSGNAPTSFIAISFMRKGGFVANETVVSEYNHKLYQQASVANNLSEGISWQEQPNQWCLFGFFLNPQTDTNLSEIYFSTTNQYYILSSSDQDVDLQLFDQNENLLEEDLEDDKTPILQFQPASDQAHRLQVLNKSKQPAMLFLGILKE